MEGVGKHKSRVLHEAQKRLRATEWEAAFGVWKHEDRVDMQASFRRNSLRQLADSRAIIKVIYQQIWFLAALRLLSHRLPLRSFKQKHRVKDSRSILNAQ